MAMVRGKKFSELARSYPGQLVGEDTLVGGITYDSRQVKEGDLFVAVRGLVDDGHRYLTEALERGSKAVVVEEIIPLVPVPQLVVRDSRQALAQLAAAFYDHPSRCLKIVGVTGTNGKTTSTGFIRSIMERAGERTGLIGTVETVVGGKLEQPGRTTPESADLQGLLARMVEAGDTAAVMEVSSHALELHRVDACEFDLAVFTNLTQDHLDFHRTFARYREAKGRLFVALGSQTTKGYPRGAALNADDPASAYFQSLLGVPKLTYGFSSSAQVRAEGVKLGLSFTEFSLHSPQGQAKVRLGLPGRFNVSNALAAASIGLLAGITLDAVVEGLETFAGVRGRLELVAEGQEFTVLVDYAHTPDGLEKVLETVKELARGRVIAVFGCGGDRDRGKRPLMGRIAARLADFTFLTSDNPRSEDPLAILEEIEGGFREAGISTYCVVEDRAAAIEGALEMAGGADVVLIAGKGHEGYQLFRDRRVLFDDVQVARRVLRRLAE